MSENRALWQPDPQWRATTTLGRFCDHVAERFAAPTSTYDELWQWSVDHLASFWEAVWDFFEVPASVPPTQVLDRMEMPGARWFTGARLNYATLALSHPDAAVAIVERSQTRPRRELTYGQLRAEVRRVRAGLQRLGVGPGDRVAAYLPNLTETTVAFLATVSLGAVWSSCAPEFGVEAVLDRFSQIEPTVLLAVDGYRYGTKDIGRGDEVDRIRAGLPSLAATVWLDYLRPGVAGPEGTVAWDDFTAEDGPLDLEQVPADHPLYVLYSSGTTGLPKPIVHHHGGILLEHLKVLGLHADIGPGDRFFWFTTTGWMMWNYLMSGLLMGSTIVLFDGDPGAPDLSTLWSIAAEERITWFGGSAPFYVACRKAGLEPGTTFDLSALRAVGSTGAPLPPDGFTWIYESVSPRVLLSSISGGTDICSAFVGGCPAVPVWVGEISCRYLGAAVAAFDDTGRPVHGEQGELVVTAPMPSMPLGFWGDDSGERYRAAYFDTYPGVWRHGDWVTITDRGSCVISGRSDATLNRSGVRIGTAEIYRVVDALAGVSDSAMVHLEDPSGEGPGTLILFVVPADGAREVSAELSASIRTALRQGLSPRHVPDELHAVRAIPTTLSGKKLELPIKKILLGADPDAVAARGALKDPAALDEIVSLARRR